MNDNFENMSLENYVDIKRIEQDLVNREQELKQERINLASPLYELGKENKNIVDKSLLPDDFEKLDTEDLNLRFKVIKSNIRRSSMNEREKNNAMDNIEAIERRITRNISALSLTLRSREKVKQARKEREIYLEDKRLEIDNLKQEIKEEQEILKKHLEGRTTAIEIGVAQTVIDAYDMTIPELEENLNKLRMSLNSLISEPGLREELDLYMESQNIIQEQINDLLEIENNDPFEDLVEEIKESISEEPKELVEEKDLVVGESQEFEIEELEDPVIEEKNDLEEPKETISEEKKELEPAKDLTVGESQEFKIEEEIENPVIEEKKEQPIIKPSEEKTTKEYNDMISYPFEKSNDTSMYKKKSELDGISDDLVGKWVVKGENDKYINIDNAKDFQPEDAILVLPDNAKIDNKNGTYDIPDASQLPNNYKENEFFTEKEEEQFEIVSSHRNWNLEQKIKFKKSLRVILGIASLMATTASIATGVGLLTAVPLGVMANNLIQGIKESPEREVVKNSKRIYEDTKDFVNNYGYLLPEDVRNNIIDIAKKVKETEKLVMINKNNGTLQLDMVTRLDYLNQKLSSLLEDAYDNYYEFDSMNSKKR